MQHFGISSLPITQQPSARSMARRFEDNWEAMLVASRFRDAQLDTFMTSPHYEDSAFGDDTDDATEDNGLLSLDDVEKAMDEFIERCIQLEIADDDIGHGIDTPEPQEVPLPRIHPWHGALLEPCPEPDRAAQRGSADRSDVGGRREVMAAASIMCALFQELLG
eukprot:CAMPEP_0204585684 /NCGR_PEP_ID=MMETSP0661-20131031/47059_1 /ASSEMBLY_ACC=CAM_ASM_000606 /TAXON_ID=109239 /ORGANISM="Alexandrium margalefi, Strain AMGDE01CS-322" /LENGTH=163 /DNA_ID=CAMNT_0051595253 /DNA_START=109 /DNA_END=601 /DNA_ORIENTATION=-